MTLPEAARKKLAKLQTAEDEAAVLANSAAMRVKELRDQQANNPLDPEVVAQVEQQIADFEAARASHQERRVALAATVGNIRRWLERRLDVEVAPPVGSPLRSGESLDQALDRVRHEITVATTQLDATLASRLPAQDLRKKLEGYVQDLAQRGRPKINAERGQLNISFGNPSAYTPPSAAEFVATVAWIAPDLLLERLKTEVDQLPEIGLVLSAVEKAERIAALTDHIDAAERAEEAIVEQAAAQGRYLARRPNAHPACVLGVVVRSAKRKAA